MAGGPKLLLATGTQQESRDTIYEEVMAMARTVSLEAPPYMPVTATLGGGNITIHTCSMGDSVTMDATALLARLRVFQAAMAEEKERAIARIARRDDGSWIKLQFNARGPTVNVTWYSRDCYGWVSALIPFAPLLAALERELLAAA